MSEAVRRVEGERTEEREPRFKLIPFESLKPNSAPSCLVQGLIPRVGLTVAWGPPKCGKSFWAYDISMHVALNWTYRGRRVLGGPVVYCAFEGAAGFGQRAEAFRMRFLAEDQARIPFFLSPARVDLVKDHAELIACIRAQLAENRIGQPALVVLDTLNRSLRGSESNDEDMSAFVNAADAIREAFHCAVLIVHHCGIEASRPRGHTSLSGAVDAQLSVQGGKGKPVVVTIEHMKDGPEGDTITSVLEKVEVGVDEFGDAVTSCVVVPADREAFPESVTTRKLSNRQLRAIDALKEAVAVQGRSAPASLLLPQDIRVVSIEEWQKEMDSMGILATANPRAAFQQLRDALGARKEIAERDGLVWSCR